MILEVEGYTVSHYAKAYDSYVLFYQCGQLLPEFIMKISVGEDRVALSGFLVSGNTVQ